jgi:hypothetical protein
MAHAWLDKEETTSGCTRIMVADGDNGFPIAWFDNEETADASVLLLNTMGQ